MNTSSCSDIFLPNHKGSIARIRMILLVCLYALYSLVCSYGTGGPAAPHWLCLIQKHVRRPVTGCCRKGRIFQTERGFSPTIIHSALSSAQSGPKCSILHWCKILPTVFNEKSCKKDCRKIPETWVFRASTQLHYTLTLRVFQTLIFSLSSLWLQPRKHKKELSSCCLKTDTQFYGNTSPRHHLQHQFPFKLSVSYLHLIIDLLTGLLIHRTHLIFCQTFGFICEK